MKKYSLQLRLTLIVGLITALACIFLTLNSLYSAHSYYGDYAELIQSGMVEYDLMLPQDEGMLEFDPLASYERATRKFSLQSLLAMGSIVLLSLAAAYWATGRVMKPLKELTESVQSMNDQNLNQRMSLDKTQGEVLILGESYNHMLARLEESFLIQKSFAANAAHELKTPLAIIKASSEVLKMTPSPKIEDYEEFMQDTDQSLNRIIKTVDGLLALANSSSALLDRVDLFLLLQQAVSELKPVAQKHKLTLELEADDNVTVTGNKDLLYRLLFNLIENAIKYNKQGGNVKISLHLVSKYAEVKVEDTGIGIQPQAIDHIFEPFYREDVSRSQQIPGSGLGLAVVKMIAEHHQGKVEVSSEPGIGSIFILTLPVSE